MAYSQSILQCLQRSTNPVIPSNGRAQATEPKPYIVFIRVLVSSLCCITVWHLLPEPCLNHLGPFKHLSKPLLLLEATELCGEPATDGGPSAAVRRGPRQGIFGAD